MVREGILYMTLFKEKVVYSVNLQKKKSKPIVLS